MIDRYEEMSARVPGVEPGGRVGRGDWDGWVRLTERLVIASSLVGDDTLVTNPRIITEAIRTAVGKPPR
jgi:enolase